VALCDIAEIGVDIDEVDALLDGARNRDRLVALREGRGRERRRRNKRRSADKHPNFLVHRFWPGSGTPGSKLSAERHKDGIVRVAVC